MLRAISLLIVLSCCSVVGYSFVFCCMMMVLVATPFVLNDVVGHTMSFLSQDAFPLVLREEREKSATQKRTRLSLSQAAMLE